MYYIKLLSKKKNKAPYLGQWYILEIKRKIVYTFIKEMVSNDSAKEREKEIIAFLGLQSRGFFLQHCKIQNLFT